MKKTLLFLIDHLHIAEIYSYMKSLLEKQILIIVYHRVAPSKPVWSPVDCVNLSLFEKQVLYLKRRYKLIRLGELRELLRKRSIPRRIAILTFDDGYKDHYKYVYPILKRYSIPATFFIPTGYIDSEKLLWWDEVGYILWHTPLKKLHIEGIGILDLTNKDSRVRAIKEIIWKLTEINNRKREIIIEKLRKEVGVRIPKQLAKEDVLSWEEIKEMSEEDLFEFGAHTVTHPILTKVPLNVAENEIYISKRDLEKRIGKKVDTFAYPVGRSQDFNETIISLLKKYGFKCAVTTIPYINTLKTNIYTLGRIKPGWNCMGSFRLLTSGLYYDLLHIIYKLRMWR